MSSFRQSLDEGSTVPAAAARWIVRTLLDKPQPEYWEQTLSSTISTGGAGLRLLTGACILSLGLLL